MDAQSIQLPSSLMKANNVSIIKNSRYKYCGTQVIRKELLVYNKEVLRRSKRATLKSIIDCLNEGKFYENEVYVTNFGITGPISHSNHNKDALKEIIADLLEVPDAQTPSERS